MDKLKSIDQKLSQIRTSLDTIAKEIYSSDISCNSADIENIGKALAAISDIQLSIYEKRPDLMPKYLNEKVKNPDINRRFGRILIQNQSLLSRNKSDEAISLLKKFIEEDPPDNYLEMAQNEIERINKLFNS